MLIKRQKKSVPKIVKHDFRMFCESLDSWIGDLVKSLIVDNMVFMSTSNKQKNGEQACRSREVPREGSTYLQ